MLGCIAWFLWDSAKISVSNANNERIAVHMMRTHLMNCNNFATPPTHGQPFGAIRNRAAIAMIFELPLCDLSTAAMLVIRGPEPIWFCVCVCDKFDNTISFIVSCFFVKISSSNGNYKWNRHDTANRQQCTRKRHLTPWKYRTQCHHNKCAQIEWNRRQCHHRTAHAWFAMSPRVGMVLIIRLYSFSSGFEFKNFT